jgi:GH15 family glucan-1,4-alpha-glucosidase
LIGTDLHAGIETFAMGRKAFQGAEGTWRDAEDGVLSNSSIMEGSVDSTFGRTLHVPPGESRDMYYWIAVGTSHGEVAELHDMVRDRTPSTLLRRTQNYWRAWVNKNDLDFDSLPASIVESFKRSLLIVRTQIDDSGAITAANDSDVTARATDHYSYVWMRDGALVAYALDLAGYPNLTRAFFRFCAETIEPEGYFLQKYNPDGSPASSWHARWDAATRRRLAPIQQDETSLVLWALWHHYVLSRDIEFIRSIYRRLITRAADFIVDFRDAATGLPLPSWNLWEDRRGIHTFTVAANIGALGAAAQFAELFGETDEATRYRTVADEMRDAMRKHLYQEDHKRFARALMPTQSGEFLPDMTLDASLFGIFYFDALDTEDECVTSTMRAVEERLTIKTEVGGCARFEADGYMSVTGDTTNVPGNPWFICTFWLADYHIARARSSEELDRALPLIEWAVRRALPSGAFAEQIHPYTGEPLSVAPLTWSHSTFVATVMAYLKKRSEVSASETELALY